MKKLRIYLKAHFGDWPVFRVTYSNGERTRPLHYGEAKSCSQVWTGELWLDYEYAEKLMFQL